MSKKTNKKQPAAKSNVAPTNATEKEVPMSEKPVVAVEIPAVEPAVVEPVVEAEEAPVAIEAVVATEPVVEPVVEVFPETHEEKGMKRTLIEAAAAKLKRAAKIMSGSYEELCKPIDPEDAELFGIRKTSLRIRLYGDIYIQGSFEEAEGSFGDNSFIVLNAMRTMNSLEAKIKRVLQGVRKWTCSESVSKLGIMKTTWLPLTEKEEIAKVEAAFTVLCRAFEATAEDLLKLLENEEADRKPLFWADEADEGEPVVEIPIAAQEVAEEATVNETTIQPVVDATSDVSVSSDTETDTTTETETQTMTQTATDTQTATQTETMTQTATETETMTETATANDRRTYLRARLSEVKKPIDWALTIGTHLRTLKGYNGLFVKPIKGENTTALEGSVIVVQMLLTQIRSMVDIEGLKSFVNQADKAMTDYNETIKTLPKTKLADVGKEGFTPLKDKNAQAKAILAAQKLGQLLATAATSVNAAYVGQLEELVPPMSETPVVEAPAVETPAPAPVPSPETVMSSFAAQAAKEFGEAVKEAATKATAEMADVGVEVSAAVADGKKEEEGETMKEKAVKTVKATVDFVTGFSPVKQIEEWSKWGHEKAEETKEYREDLAAIALGLKFVGELKASRLEGELDAESKLAKDIVAVLESARGCGTRIEIGNWMAKKNGYTRKLYKAVFVALCVVDPLAPMFDKINTDLTCKDGVCREVTVFDVMGEKGRKALTDAHGAFRRNVNRLGLPIAEAAYRAFGGLMTMGALGLDAVACTGKAMWHATKGAYKSVRSWFAGETKDAFKASAGASWSLAGANATVALGSLAGLVVKPLEAAGRVVNTAYKAVRDTFVKKAPADEEPTIIEKAGEAISSFAAKAVDVVVGAVKKAWGWFTGLFSKKAAPVAVAAPQGAQG